MGKTLFGFPIDVDPKSKEVIESKRFVTDASYFIRAFDASLSLLGPDIELLTEVMIELGFKHARYGVTVEMYPIMEECLIIMLEEKLPGGLTKETREAWMETFDALTADMIHVSNY
jgi:hypothetical protein